MLEIQGRIITAGVDEAGRGPLAGPVFAAAVILDPQNPIKGLADSKKLTEKERDLLFPMIMRFALAYGIGRAEVSEIDEINILQASLLAMQRAVAALKIIPHLALVDGNRAPLLNCETRTIIGGDDSEPAISAASIVAKVSRDREMTMLDKQFPQYGFAKHKGYGTKDHIAALVAHGACSIHRKTFAPVALVLTRDATVIIPA
jgi:ribonuclease HII